MNNKYVCTEHECSPRGDCYDWCKLEEDGTLTFGSEEGNYAGGATVTLRYFKRKTAQDYMEALQKRLEYYRVHNNHFYDDIITMLNENCVTFDDILHHAITVRGE